MHVWGILGQGPLLRSPSSPPGDSPPPLTPPFQLGSPDGFSPWAPEALRKGGRSWGARIPGSLRTLDWLSYFPTPKKTGREPEAGVGVGVGGEKGERSKGEGWPAKVGRASGLSITLAGGITAWPSSSPQAATPGEAGQVPLGLSGRARRWGPLSLRRGGSVCLSLRPISIFSAANPVSACCPPH